MNAFFAHFWPFSAFSGMSNPYMGVMGRYFGAKVNDGRHSVLIFLTPIYGFALRASESDCQPV
jgi:hypothetical protein